jgi:hypothetical protein
MTDHRPSLTFLILTTLTPPINFLNVDGCLIDLSKFSMREAYDRSTPALCSFSTRSTINYKSC